MKYLVLKSERSIKFFPFDGPGDSVILNSERSNLPFYVRECVTDISGLITVNEINNYGKGGTLIVMTHSGCNIRVDDELLPQGACEMTIGRKYVAQKVTLFLINEEEKSDVQDAFNEENEVDCFNGDDDYYYNSGNYVGEEENWDDDIPTIPYVQDMWDCADISPIASVD